MIAEIIPLTVIRKRVAEQVAKGYENPQVTITAEPDVTEVFKVFQELKSKQEKESGLKLTFLHLIIKAVVLALKDYPILNSTFKDGEIRVFKDVNIAVAASTEEGLKVPVVHHAQDKTLAEIASAVQDLSQKARSEKLSIEDVTGGTFTVSNLGAFGVVMFTPILNYPQCAILGVGQLADKVIVVEGNIEIRKVLTLSLTFDHRVTDGVPAAQFLRRLGEILQMSSILKNGL